MTITITCVFGKFTAFVLGILVEMNVCTVHSRILVLYRTKPYCHLQSSQYPLRLWPKTLSIGIFPNSRVDVQ